MYWSSVIVHSPSAFALQLLNALQAELRAARGHDVQIESKAARYVCHELIASGFALCAARLHRLIVMPAMSDTMLSDDLDEFQAKAVKAVVKPSGPSVGGRDQQDPRQLYALENLLVALAARKTVRALLLELYAVSTWTGDLQFWRGADSRNFERLLRSIRYSILYCIHVLYCTIHSLYSPTHLYFSLSGSSEAARVLLCAHLDRPAAGGMGFEARGGGARVARRPGSKRTRRARDTEPEPVAAAPADRRAALRALAAPVHRAARESTRGDQHTRARVGRPECAHYCLLYTRNFFIEHLNWKFDYMYCTRILVCLQNTQTQFGRYLRSRVFETIMRNGENLSLFQVTRTSS